MEESHLGAMADAGRLLLDVLRTDLHCRFFQTFLYELASELLDDVEKLPIDYDAFALSRDARRYGYSGWLYWLIYLKGYTQYRPRAVVEESNVYYRYLASREGSAVESTLSAARNQSALFAQISRRFADCHELSEPGSGSHFAEQVVHPVTVFTRPQRAEDDVLGVYPEGSTDPIWARLVDGHHRLFAARLFGIKRMRFTVLVEAEFVPRVAGHIEHITVVGDRLEMSGWVTPVDPAADAVEVRSGGRTLCFAPLSPVQPTAVADMVATPTGRYAFALEADTLGSGSELDTLDLMILADWMPVGKFIVRLR